MSGRECFKESVKESFQFLVDDYAFTLARIEEANSFDFTSVYWESEDCSIRVSLEKGDVFVDLASMVHNPGYWHSMEYIVAYLTEADHCEFLKKPELDYEATIRWQTQEQAGIVQRYCVQICALFDKENFGNERAELITFVKELEKLEIKEC